MGEPDYEVAIIGAGPGGIAAAKLLRDKGISDFIILERSHDFGGTWRDNHYPGLAVDIPVLWYQLSFAPNPNWTRFFAPGPEIYHYLRDTAARFKLYKHLHTNAEVVQQKWDTSANLWHLSIKDQQAVSARFVINSVGGYVNAKQSVDIDGIEGRMPFGEAVGLIDLDKARGHAVLGGRRDRARNRLAGRRAGDE